MSHNLPIPGEEKERKEFSSDIVQNERILLDALTYALINRRRTVRFFYLKDISDGEFKDIINVLRGKGKRLIVWDDLVSGRTRKASNWDIVVRAIAHLLYDINFGCIIGRVLDFTEILRRMGVGFVRLDDTVGLGFEMRDDRDKYGFRLVYSPSGSGKSWFIEKAKTVFIAGVEYNLVDGDKIIIDRLGEGIFVENGKLIEGPLKNPKPYALMAKAIADELINNKNMIVLTEYVGLVPGVCVIPSESEHYRRFKTRSRFGPSWDQVLRSRNQHDRIRLAFRVPKFNDFVDAFNSIGQIDQKLFSSRVQMTRAEVISSFINSVGGEFPYGGDNTILNNSEDTHGRQLSHMLRISLYKISAEVCKKVDMLPLIVGAGPQTVDDLARTNLIAVCIDKLPKNAFRVFDDRIVGNTDYAKIEYRQHTGQMKLLAVDFPVIALNCDVIAFGGCPGDHFNNFSFNENKRLTVIDPGEINKELLMKPGVTHIKRMSAWRDLHIKRYFCLIDDIRSDPIGEKDDFWYLTIWWEMMKMYSFALCARNMGYMLAVSFKTRGHWFLPICFFSNPIYQPFQHSKSYETRQIFGAYGPWIMNIMRPERYRFGCESWAVSRNANFGINGIQEESLLNTFVMKASYPDIKTEFLIDTFALSNTYNTRSVISDGVALHSVQIHVCPRVPFNKFWRNTANLMYEKSLDGYTMREIVGAKTYTDNCFSFSKLEMDYDFCAYDIRDIVYRFYGGEGRFMSNGFQFKSVQWGVLIGGLMPWDLDVQSIENSQTMFVKVFPEIVRSIRNWDDESLYDYRRAVMESKGLTPVYVSEHVAIDGKGKSIQVSGHAANMLFFLPFRVLSLKRYFNCNIANIVAIAKHNSQAYKRIKACNDNGNFIERTP